MQKINNHNMKITNILSIALVFGVSLTGCVKKTPPPDDNEPFISCTIPEIDVQTPTSVNSRNSSFKTKNLVESTNTNLSKLTILSVNDTHGSIEQNSSGNFGFGRVGTYVDSVRNVNQQDDVITVSAGDMFQGSALSNLTRGRAVIDVMNEVGFDAMTIGNHEFDWGIDTILRYNDDDLTNGEANFPILNANIIDKESRNPVSFNNPYTIIQKENIKVGIIGLIGMGIESSIAAQMIKDYEFVNPVTIAGNYAEILRTQQAVDIVIALGHFDDQSTNQGLADLADNRKIDAIINGHGHSTYAQTISRSTGVSVPVVQAGANAQRVGKIELTIGSSKNIASVNASTVYMDQGITPDEGVEQLIAASVEAVAPIMNRVYGVAGENLYSASEVYQWAPSVIQKGMGVDVGITNSGGLRSGAFPIYTGSEVKYKNMVALMPFDNYLIYMKLPGSFLRNYSGNLISVRAGLTIKNDATLYRVAIVDYEADNNPVLFGASQVEYTRTNILLMDLFAYDVYVASRNGGNWRPKTNGASLSSVCTFKN